MLLPYWNHSGQKAECKAWPESFEDWNQGNELAGDRQALHTAVEKILNQKIARTMCRAKDMNLTLDVLLDNGSSVIVRQRLVYRPADNNWNLLKFKTEIELLHWLKENTKVPVPAVLAVYHSSYEFSIQEKLPGKTAYIQWNNFSDAQKNHFLSQYVDVAVELFRLPVPQRIGSSGVRTVNGIRIMDVRPRIGANQRLASSEVFDNISQYFAFLITYRRSYLENSPMNQDEKERGRKTLDAIEAVMPSLIEKIDDPALLRCVLSHGDLGNLNVLVSTDGDITGIIDWEINYIQPAILAAEYPVWLSDDGKEDPIFALDDNIWDASPEERHRLRELVDAIASKQNPEYYKCLIQGRDLRALVGWLTDWLDDPGFDQMGRWAVSKLGINLP